MRAFSTKRTRLTDAIKKLPGLVAYYPMNEMSGTICRNNAPSNLSNINGSLNGALLGQTGRVGSSYTFDGNDDMIENISGLSFTGPFTFFCIFSRSDDNPNWIIGKSGTNVKIGFFGGTLNVNLFTRFVGAGSSQQTDIGYTTAKNGLFNSITITRDANDNIFFSLNGSAYIQAASSQSGTFAPTTFGFDHAADYLAGKLQHVFFTSDSKSFEVIKRINHIGGFS